MTEFGYTMMCEQSPPDALVRDIQRAEAAGFDFSQISDHFQPWLVEQGHSGYAWSVLGAAAAVTERIGLMTYVTCPTIRYHPAIVAQKAATVQILSGGRFRLGLGAGENLNEHVVGNGWPAVAARHSMLSEAIDVIAALFDAPDGDAVSWHGDHYDLATARLWDRHEKRVPIGVAVSGSESCALAGRKADFMVAVQPEAELGEMFDAAGGTGKGRVGQIAVSYDEDRAAALKRAHEQFRWFGLGWKVMADLPNPDAFDAAAQFVTESDVEESIPCGADVEEFVDKIKPFVDAGFTEVGLVQIGGDHQDAFIDWAERELLPALREL
jgi:G6PDH family F420-dependent oxidoreductase